MSEKFEMPNAGSPDRFWVVKHQPNKKSSPVRVELREAVISGSAHTESLARLIGFEDTVAAEKQLYETALAIRSRVGRVEEFVGIHDGKKSTEE